MPFDQCLSGYPFQMPVLPAFSSELVPVVLDACFVAGSPAHQPQVLPDLTNYLIPSMNFLLDAIEKH